MAHTTLAVPPYVCVFVEYRCVCECVLLLHSHFPLQVERLLYVVVATAQVDDGDIAADRHLLLVLLLQLEDTLQVLGGCQKNQSSRDWWLFMQEKNKYRNFKKKKFPETLN